MSTKIQFQKQINIPKPLPKQKVFKVNLIDLHPTQMCVGLSEVWSRKKEFAQESKSQIMSYLLSKPIPIVKNNKNELWILDRHHRLRALIELDQKAEGYGYLIDIIDTSDNYQVLKFLAKKGWLYLYDSRGNGPKPLNALPNNLLNMEDDPYRSLVWKLKKEGFVSPQPVIPYHEFLWGKWLRTRPLPPFNSKNLSPALPIARNLASSQEASHLAGWKGIKI